MSEGIEIPLPDPAEQAALERQRMWESIGMPMSPMYMSEEQMDRDFRGRFSCVNADVLREAQQALKFVACPDCVVTKNHGEITVTRFHIRVTDDIMTTFKAMARCFCYNCGHEEYWPLQRDPRAHAGDTERSLEELLKLHRRQQKRAYNQQAKTATEIKAESDRLSWLRSVYNRMKPPGA